MEKYDSILSGLKFLSKLKKGEKIMVKTMTIQQSDFMSSVYRSFTGETRQDTFDFVFELWSEAVKLILSETTSDEYKKILLCDLQESRKGTHSLLSTYETDRHFCSKLESLISTVEIQVRSVEPEFSLVVSRKENASLARSQQAFSAMLKKD